MASVESCARLARIGVVLAGLWFGVFGRHGLGEDGFSDERAKLELGGPENPGRKGRQVWPAAP